MQKGRVPFVSFLGWRVPERVKGFSFAVTPEKAIRRNIHMGGENQNAE